MDLLSQAITAVQSFLWDGLLILLLCGTGLFFTIRLKGIQLRRFGSGLREMFSGFSLKGEKAGKHGMSSFQAVTTAIAGQVGTGNLAGAATAILLGGPGPFFGCGSPLFWEWPPFMRRPCWRRNSAAWTRMDRRWAAPRIISRRDCTANGWPCVFAVLLVLALGFMGNMVQSNSIAVAFETSLGVPTWVGGLVVALLAGVILLGGIGRIASFTEKVVPVMACLYIAGGLVVLVINWDQILPALGSIFRCAFQPSAAFGGVAGYTVLRAMKYGVARGLFSNEAGMGSTPHAHAVAKTDHPSKQGHLAIVSVFFDTFVVLTLTALVILTSGVLPGMITPEAQGIDVTQAAFSASFGSLGSVFIAVCLLFFAFSTIISWYYYGETNVRYLFRSSKAVPVYKLLVVLFVFAGSLFQSAEVWALSDVFNGLMVIPNVIALLLLSPVVAAMCREDKPLKKRRRNRD